MRFAISHITRYSYSEPARSSINEVRLAPEETARQSPGELNLTVNPDTSLHQSRDLFGNLVHEFEIEEAHDELVISADSIVETHSGQHLVSRAMELPMPDLKSLEVDEWDFQFLGDSTFVKKNPDLWREALDVHCFCEPTWGAVIGELSRSVFETCTYRKQWIHQMNTAEDIRQSKTGTCQDFAHLLLGYCRALGIPSRYLSGYLYDSALDAGEKSGLIGAGQSHAWVEVAVPELGWVGIDPTNKKWVDENYVSVAFGRDYHDVAPVRGSLIGGGVERGIDVSVSVKASQ